MRKIVAAGIAAAVASAVLILLLPLAASRPAFVPDALYAFGARWSKTIFDYHGSIGAELVACGIAALALWLYFLIAEPRVYRPTFRPGRRRGPQPPI